MTFDSIQLSKKNLGLHLDLDSDEDNNYEFDDKSSNETGTEMYRTANVAGTSRYEQTLNDT